MEQLVKCPYCDRGNFTRAGLRHHRCSEMADGQRLTESQIAKIFSPNPAASAVSVDLPETSVAFVPAAPDSTSDAASISLAPQSGWATVRQYAGLAAKFQHASLACQVVAGFELLTLRKTSTNPAGGRRKLPNDLEVSKQPTWPELVREFAGVSDETARNWMRMAEAAKPRLQKLDASDRLRALLETPPSQWTDEDSKLMDTVVHKLTDGRTQLDFMSELGLCKAPQGSGATGGARNSSKPKPTADEELAAARQQASDDIDQIFMQLTAFSASFTLLPDFHVEAQIAEFERQIAARRQWLKLPANRRDPGAIGLLTQMLKLPATATR